MYPDVSLFIDGAWSKGATGKTLKVLNPATAEPVGVVAHADRSDLDRALAAADRGFKVWSKVSAFERYKLMRKAADILRGRADDIAKIMTQEQGKPLMQAKLETLSGADVIDWFAEEGRRAYGRVVPARAEGVHQLVIKEPVGPVAAFTPWNFPINQAVRKISAALAAGCSIIIKGPEETPGSCAELIRAYADAGIPKGVINLVFGVPSEISEYLIPHPIIRKMSFTGSTAVGKHLAALAGQHMKRVTMELGGHAPAIVFEDADVDAAAKLLAVNKFRNAGQVCVSPTRLLVQEPVYEQLRREVHRPGQDDQGRRRHGRVDPDGPARQWPPRRGDGDVHRRRHGQGREGAHRRQAHRQQGLLLRADGADRRADGRPHHERGAVRPGRAHRAVQDLRGRRRRSQPAALRSRRLCLYAVGEDRGGDRLGLESGMVSINHHGLALPEVPFGGVKDSGYGSEGGSEAIEAYLNTKFVTQVGV